MRGREIRSALAWLAAAAAIALGLGFLAAVVQEHFAPLWLFPVLQGIALGAGLVLALRATQFGGRRLAITVAAGAAALMFAAQFYGSYRRYAAAVEAKAPQGFALPHERLRPPQDMVDYLRQQARAGRPLLAGITARGGWVWATWAFDVALAAGTAALAVRWGFRRPYCQQCHKWYRPVGEGHLSRKAAGSVAQLTGVDLPQQNGQYRLWACPTAGHGTVLEVAWMVEQLPQNVAKAARPRAKEGAANEPPQPGQQSPPQRSSEQQERVTMVAIPPAKTGALQTILAEAAESHR